MKRLDQRLNVLSVRQSHPRSMAQGLMARSARLRKALNAWPPWPADSAPKTRALLKFMKTALWSPLILALAGIGMFPLPAWSQVILNPNTIQGTVRFSNTNAAVLELLNPPGDEGMADIYVSASSQPPAPAMSSSSQVIPATTRTNAAYQITVDSDPTGIAYTVSARVGLIAVPGSYEQEYYFNSRTSAVVVAGGPPVTLDFEECVGVLTVRFITPGGDPVVVDGAVLRASGLTTGSSAQRYSVPAGSTQARIYLQGGETHQLSVTVNQGTNYYTDRKTFEMSTNVAVNCDELTSVDLVIPDAGDLGQIIGAADVLGEFELTVDGSDANNIADSTGVFARFGPFQNQRWAALPGMNFTVPSSGAFTLSNLVPSTLDTNSAGYSVYAQMYLRTNRAIESFTTPALGSGRNPAVTVSPGETVNLGDRFVIEPGYLRGQIFLQGPAESLGRTSLLRGVLHAADDDADGDGVPDSIGTYGVYWTSVTAEGVDQLATGATFSASGGYAYAEFPGAFDPANSAYEGQYELVLGGLNREPSIWQQNIISVVLADTAAANSNYFYNGFSITDHRDHPVEITPGQAATNDIAYCFSEVQIVFRSTSGTFYNPQVRFSNGSFVGTDFQGHPVDYSVYVDPAFGTPTTLDTATNVGAVTLYLPQGSYRLLPLVTPSDSTYATVGLEPIDLTVGCGQRISIEECLRVELNPPPCANAGVLNVSGSVHSCTNEVVGIVYQLNNAAPVALCTNCGINPTFTVSLTLESGANTLTVTATDDQGHTSSVQSPLLADTVPPVIECPTNSVVVATRPCGAVVQFAPVVTDNCDSAPSIVCTPPSGSIFPPGDTVVTCVATDASGNAAQCGFTITVTAGPAFPPPTIRSVSPQGLGISGGAQMTVAGTDFTVDDEVLLDGEPLRYPLLVSPEEIQGQAPPLEAGTHTLQIRRCGEIVATFSNSVVCETLPRILSLDPPQAFAAGGNFATVHGSNFVSNTAIRIGFAGSNLLQNVTVSPDGTTLVGRVPPLPTSETLGPRDVMVEDARGADKLPAGITYLPNPLETDPQVISLRALQAASAEPVDLYWRNGFPGGMTTRVKVTGATPEERSRTFVRGFKDLLRLQNPDAELETKRVHSEGPDDVWLAQIYRGLRVFGSEIVVTLDGDEVVSLTGNLLPSAALDGLGFDVTPTVTADQAVELARVDRNLQRPTAELAATTELMVYDERLFTEAPLDPHLVWRVTMRFSDLTVMVDAHTGQIVAQVAQARSWDFDLDIQDAENEANSQDDWCFNLSSDTDVADEDDFNSDYNNDTDAVLANRFARDCWFYIHDTFQWDSYDDDSSQMEIFIHTTINASVVAQWDKDCDLIQFADGAVDYDVMVHEFTHGIVAATSGLEYRFQSGALDESYADTMGVIADRVRGEIETGQPINWMFGENRRAPQPTTLIRNFDYPGAARPGGRPGQPDHMTNLCCMGGSPNSGNDFGGVHSNSGIPNRAGYLMSEGGATNGFLVRAMGFDKFRHLKFSAMRNLPSNANFTDARAREIAAARWFADHAERGFVLEDVCTVRNAWAAVGAGLGDSDCDGVEDTRNDIDNDLIANRVDNCPSKANPDQKDSDGDGRGDVCDKCVNVPNPDQADLDGDGQGDVCDLDRDGDGCLNAVDQNPDSEQQVIGNYLGPLCNPQSGAIYGFAGHDTDHDGILDCQDDDDDGDGIADRLDPCPVGPLPGATLGQCTVLKDCPQIPNDWWRTCIGGGCVEYYARFMDRINPNPEAAVIVDKVNIVNQTLYLQPNAGGSVSGLAQKLAPSGQRIAGAQGTIRAAGEMPQLWRIELWARATENEPARLVAVVGDYEPGDVVRQQLDSGRLLALSLQTNGAPVFGAVWHPGEDPAAATQDTDGDGLPDGWEIQHGLNAHNPADALLDSDGDGASNLAEFQAGTDPADASSVFRIFGITQSGGSVQMEFVGTPGRSFQLERTVDLSRPVWLPVSAAVPGQGGVASLLDSTPPAGGQAFYRLQSAAQ